MAQWQPRPANWEEDAWESLGDMIWVWKSRVRSVSEPELHEASNNAVYDAVTTGNLANWLLEPHQTALQPLTPVHLCLGSPQTLVLRAGNSAGQQMSLPLYSVLHFILQSHVSKKYLKPCSRRYYYKLSNKQMMHHSTSLHQCKSAPKQY